MVSHGEEEQFEAVGLALARREASIQDIDGFRALARAIQRHAKGVEMDRLSGCQRDDMPGQENRSLGVALVERAGPMPECSRRSGSGGAVKSGLSPGRAALARARRGPRGLWRGTRTA